MTESRYVTVEDVREIIASGESIEVIDSKDDSDITRSVLLQILAEQEAGGHGTVLTNRVIEQMIRFYGDRMEPILSRYLERTMNAFLDHQDRAEDALGASLDSIRSGAESEGADHLRLIRDEFDQLKAKLDRLEAS